MRGPHTREERPADVTRLTPHRLRTPAAQRRQRKQVSATSRLRKPHLDLGDGLDLLADGAGTPDLSEASRDGQPGEPAQEKQAAGKQATPQDWKIPN